MNLEQYFKKVQSYKLSDQQKNVLYERILTNTQPKQSLFSRARFYSKVAWYAVFLGVLWLSLYLPYIGQQEAQNNTLGSVHADYIAKVVTTEGQYYIESDGKRIEGTNISDGDSIVLAKDSSLIVHVWEHVQGKIIWPATFVVRRQDAGYAITLEQWDYIEVSALWDQQETPSVALVSVNHKFTARTNAGKWFHFVLTEQNEKPLVVNKSDEALTIINQEDTKNETTTLLAQNKTIPVGETVVVARGSAAIDVAVAIAKKTEENKAIDSDFNNWFFREILLSEPATTTSTDTMVATSAKTDAPATTEETINNQAVRNNLIPQFVWVDVKYITYYYLNGQPHEYQVAYENFLKRLHNLYGAVNLEVPSSTKLATSEEAYDLATLTALTTYLRQHLPDSIPTHQANTVNGLIVFLQKLETQTFGSYKGQWLNVEEMFKKIK